MKRIITTAWGAVVALLLLSTLPAAAQSGLTCAPSPVRTVDRVFKVGGWNYNREIVANAYGLFAAASSDAYEPPDDLKKSRPFAIADGDPVLRPLGLRAGETGWQRVKKGPHQGNGLAFDVYHKNEPNRLIVLVAYRGTDGWFGADVIANLSWLTQWFNPFDQYRDAATQFSDVVQAAKARARGKPIAFVTTGHSLGGGLAQHIAHLFPCVSTVTFNPSFVTNAPLFGGQTPPVKVRVYEDKDVFSRFAGRVTNTKTDALYRMNGALGEGIGDQHSMEQLSAALMRTALDCMKRDKCELRNAKEARDLRNAFTVFCRRYAGLRSRVDDVCVRNAPTLGAFRSNESVRHD
ncbi:MAG: hypothetical protein ACRDBH_11600 [Bosea sp. (in: a-proteobacteria)]